MFSRLLQDGSDMVLDRSFWAKEDRDRYRELIGKGKGRVVLVYLKAEEQFLWNRIVERRRRGVDADSALDIKEELLDSYLRGFEVPDGEEEIVIDVEKYDHA